MNKLNCQELRIIAHYGLRCRLDDVVKVTINYQSARASYRSADDDFRAADETYHTAIELRSKLPADLGLFELAERQRNDARKRLDNAQAVLADRSDAFFNAAEPVTEKLIEAMEKARWQLSKPDLLAALEAPSTAR